MLFANIPIKCVGPIKITGSVLCEDISVPLATLERPLWHSVGRGARVTAIAGGITAEVLSDAMTRSILMEGPNAAYVAAVARALDKHTLSDVVAQTSRFAQLQDWHTQIVGNLLFIRFQMSTGDAAGHNMVTKAADALLDHLMAIFPELRYVSISGNLCTDKKVSAINGILMRGKYVVAEAVIPQPLCTQHLKTTPSRIVDLHVKKNLIGTILAGGVRTANAHFANILLGIYLATGQDAANIVEGSQGIVHAELCSEGALYFSVTLPNVIVGTVGNGKQLPFAQESLSALGCLEDRSPGDNAQRLAAIIGAAVLCGELSLLAAQTNKGELMESHIRLERA